MTNCQSFTVAAFTATFNRDLGGGIFQIKVGTKPPDDIFLDLWDVTNTPVTGIPDVLTGTNVGHVKVLQGSVTGSYSPIDFFFATPVTLQVGESYIATLTTNDDTTGAAQHFIKGADTLNIQDSTGGNGNPLTDPNATPEPSSWMMAAGGVLLAAGFRFKRAHTA